MQFVVDALHQSEQSVWEESPLPPRSRGKLKMRRQERTNSVQKRQIWRPCQPSASIASQGTYGHLEPRTSSSSKVAKTSTFAIRREPITFGSSAHLSQLLQTQDLLRRCCSRIVVHLAQLAIVGSLLCGRVANDCFKLRGAESLCSACQSVRLMKRFPVLVCSETYCKYHAKYTPTHTGDVERQPRKTDLMYVPARS